MSLSVCIAMGVITSLLASADDLLTWNAAEIGLAPFTAAPRIFREDFLPYTGLLCAFSLIGAVAFWFIIGAPSDEPARRSLVSMMGLKHFQQLILFYACLLSLHFFWTLHNERAQDDSDSGVTKLYERQGEGPSSPLVIVLPKPFRYQSRQERLGEWSHLKRVETELISFYPNLSSPREPNNVAAGLLRCDIGKGDCGGRFNLTIKNVTWARQNGGSSTYAGAEAGAFFDWRNRFGAGTTPRAPQYGFDEVFDGKALTADRYFLKRGADATKYDLVVACDTQSPNHFCKLYFSLGCEPRIGVTISFWRYERMEDAIDLRRRVEDFVTPMVQEPACQKK